ncbi:unnamed protein product [Cercopithifilaria johnstoni]|uniref:Uncharacterized protein n=1 Tax=Cercopithifilaria johnstoni TaxID=2874296 RepID=A0A8J2Q6D6_9BILA|nr:unnamed protein product [Cercopithifilaria johnstoni]
MQNDNHIETETLMSNLVKKILEMKTDFFLMTCRFPLSPSEENIQWLRFAALELALIVFGCMKKFKKADQIRRKREGEGSSENLIDG